jgi:hypothetical protein
VAGPHPRHKIYPYLLRHLTIERPNQVWCADITHIQMRQGFLYLDAIMDWTSRKAGQAIAGTPTLRAFGAVPTNGMLQQVTRSTTARR